MAAVLRIGRCRWRGNAMRVATLVLPMTLCPEIEVPEHLIVSSPTRQTVPNDATDNVVLHAAAGDLALGPLGILRTEVATFFDNELKNPWIDEHSVPRRRNTVNRLPN